MRHKVDDPFAIEATRAASSRLGKYAKMLPPVTHEPIQWTHFCHNITWRHRLIARLEKLPLLALIAVLGYVTHDYALLLVNPIITVTYIATKLTGNAVVGLVGLAVWLITYLLVNRKLLWKIAGAVSNNLTLEAGALEEEIWFREGAENWTWRQRAKSCWIFTTAHSMPWWCGVWPLLGFQLSGSVVYMGVYLRTYRRTQSREAALLDAAKVHYWANHTLYRPLSIAMLGAAVVSCVLSFT